MNTQPANFLAFEIKTTKDYDLAVEMRPDLSGITFEALKGHFFALTSDLQFATFPPEFLSKQTTISKGEFPSLNLMRITN